jgi:hypothetical protein
VRVAGSPTKRWLFRGRIPYGRACPTPDLRDLGDQSVEDALRAPVRTGRDRHSYADGSSGRTSSFAAKRAVMLDERMSIRRAWPQRVDLAEQKIVTPFVRQHPLEPEVAGAVAVRRLCKGPGSRVRRSGSWSSTGVN